MSRLFTYSSISGSSQTLKYKLVQRNTSAKWIGPSWKSPGTQLSPDPPPYLLSCPLSPYPFLPVISLPFPPPPSPSLIASPLLTYRWLGRYNRSDRSWYGVRRCGRMGGRGCRLCVSIDVIGRCVWPSVGGWGWVCRIWDCGWDIGVWGWVWV